MLVCRYKMEDDQKDGVTSPEGTSLSEETPHRASRDLPCASASRLSLLSAAARLEAHLIT